MPIESLDTTPALVVIDLQKGIATRVAPEVIAPVVDNSAKLAAAFRAQGWPVVLVNVTGGAPGRTDAGKDAPARPAPDADWADLMPELGRQEGDILVTKKTWGAFYDTGLDDELKKRGVTQVVLTGVATSIGVESTARPAYEHGYHVALVSDAMADLDQAMHDHAIAKVFPRLGEVATTAEILAAIA